MNAIFSSDVWLGALLVFVMRVANMSLDTVRVMMVVRGRKSVAWLMGFTQTIIFIFVLTTVLNDFDNWLTIIAYAGGFATGNVVGMWIEDRLALGHTHLRIISMAHGVDIAEKVREEGHAVTEIVGRGRDGVVSLLNVSVRRKNVDKVCEIVQGVDEDAFITAEALRPIRRGYWGGFK